MESDWKHLSSHSSRRCNNSPRESLEYLPANHSISTCPIRKLGKTHCYRSFPNSQQSPCLSCQRSYRGEGTTSGPRIPIRYFNNNTENHCSSCEFQVSAQKSRNNYRYRRTHAGNESPPLTAKPSEMQHESKFLKSPKSNENISYFTANLPVINSNLLNAILQIIGPTDTGYIALTVILQSNDLYHINISVTNTGQSLGDVYTTETALQQAEQNRLFERFLTFFVLNSNNTLEQKNRILGHSFEFLNLENSQKHDDQNMDNLGTKTSNTSEDSLKISSDNPLSPEIFNSKNKNSPEFRRKAGESNDYGNSPETKNLVLNKDIQRESPLDETKYDSYNTRLDNLELELKKMRQDLHQLNGKLMPQDKWSKLQQFGEKLKDLYSLLEYLRNASITGAGSRPKEMAEQADDKSEYNTEQCQQFTAEINRHPTLLEKYLLTLKDFRTDAELRRQRLERRWQEKLLRKQQRQQQTKQGYGLDIDHKSPRKLSDGNIKQFVGKVVRKLVEVSSRQVVQEKHVNTPTQIKRNINEVENSSTQFNWEEYGNPQNSLNVKITDANDAKSHPSSKSVKKINGLYHISLSDAHTGESLACLYASKEAIREAQRENLFKKYLTFFLLSGDPLIDEVNPLIGHLFEIVQ
ncbi:uncharacterized protein LOC101898274 [Musca domestica]|uniref:Uncharacterized protein LOC101898274 n=1 Tax=Musca domestica TaxID=7370 RepID=A0ABM3UQQ3_MUSDO|nr:uncharacterized protein LOC101898274 [Musca domestica]